jgi:hypothetical protein
MRYFFHVRSNAEAFDDDVGETSGAPVPKPAGRPPGVQNKLTRIIKEAILLAGEEQGNALADAKKEVREGLVSYLKWLADKYPAILCDASRQGAADADRAQPHDHRGLQDGRGAPASAARPRFAGRAHLPDARVRAHQARRRRGGARHSRS